MNLFSEIENFITSTVWPFLKNIGKSVVKAEIVNLQHIATKLVASAESAIVSAAASGSIGQLGGVLGGLIAQTAVEAENAAITAGATSILASIGTALASNPATAVSLTPVVLAPVVNTVLDAASEPTG